MYPFSLKMKKTFSKLLVSPVNEDAQYDYWLSASTYLSYGGVLRVLRTDGTTLNNANNDGASSVKIKSYEDYENNHSTGSTWEYAAKNPGRWANNLKVCTIDGAADQIITGVSTTNVSVGMGVTQSIAGRVNAGSGSTSAYDGYLRGIITEVGGAMGGYLNVKIVDRVSADGTVTAAEYQQGGSLEFTAPTTVTTTTSVGIATNIAGVVDTAFDASISGIVTTGLAVNDVVTMSLEEIPQ